MLIVHANAFVNGAFEPDTCVRLEEGTVRETGARLAARPGEETVDARGRYLLPGFVDVHIHAFRGKDTMDGEEAVRHMSRELYRVGVAAFLPTTMSASIAGYPTCGGGNRRGDGTSRAPGQPGAGRAYGSSLPGGEQVRRAAEGILPGTRPWRRWRK